MSYPRVVLVNVDALVHDAMQRVHPCPYPDSRNDPVRDVDARRAGGSTLGYVVLWSHADFRRIQTVTIRPALQVYSVPGDAWILGYFTDTWSFSIQDTAYSKKQVSGIRILSADTCTFAQTRPRREKKVDYMYM